MSEAETTPKPERPLTFGLTAIFGLETLSNHLSQFLKTCAAPVVIIGLGTALPALTGMDMTSGGTVVLTLIGVLISLIGSILAMSFNVSWRRYLILGENPSVVYFGEGFWSWLGRSLLVGLCFGAVTGVIGGIVTVAFGSHFMPTEKLTADASPTQMIKQLAPIYCVFLLCSVPGFWWILRHVPYFTAQTVGDYDLTWKECSPLMRGRVAIYFFGIIAGTLPMLIPQLLAQFAAQGRLGTFPPVVTVVLSLVGQFFAFAYVAVYASITALFYARLVPNRPRAV